MLRWVVKRKERKGRNRREETKLFLRAEVCTTWVDG